jgi:hypothetical protein
METHDWCMVLKFKVNIYVNSVSLLILMTWFFYKLDVERKPLLGYGRQCCCHDGLGES